MSDSRQEQVDVLKTLRSSPSYMKQNQFQHIYKCKRTHLERIGIDLDIECGYSSVAAKAIVLPRSQSFSTDPACQFGFITLIQTVSKAGMPIKRSSKCCSTAFFTIKASLRVSYVTSKDGR